MIRVIVADGEGSWKFVTCSALTEDLVSATTCLLGWMFDLYIAVGGFGWFVLKAATSRVKVQQKTALETSTSGGHFTVTYHYFVRY